VSHKAPIESRCDLDTGGILFRAEAASFVSARDQSADVRQH
jgi:hypothetical protein